MSQILINALRETSFMVFTAGFGSILIGIPFGILIASIANTQNRFLQTIFFAAISILNAIKSIPYIMLMLLFIPVTNWLINQNISYIVATILPLTTAGSLILAQSVFAIVKDLSNQWQTTSKILGANKQQTLMLMILPEALCPILQASANACAMLVGFSAIAGALGAGGLGQLAIEKSIQDANPLYVVACIILLVAMQQLIQYIGSFAVRQLQTR